MSFAGKRVLVTGAAGFIGSHLVDALVLAGAQVTALDNLSSGSKDNLASSLTSLRLVQADIRDAAAVREACRGQELVFHFAANADVPASVRDPDLDFETNLVGSQRLLRACIQERVGRVLFATSAAVYGNPKTVPMDEEHPCHPVSPYGASKLGAEKLGLAYAQVYGLPFTSIRIFNTYGERQPRYVMHDLLNKLQHAPAVLEVMGTGKQERDFCHVADACQLFLKAALAKEAAGQVYNLAGGQTVSIAELARLLVRLTGLDGKTEVRFTGQSWPGDIAQLVGDTRRARSQLGFLPGVSLEAGLNRLIDWCERTRGWKLRH